MARACIHCLGTGREVERDDDGTHKIHKCPYCNGTGRNEHMKSEQEQRPVCGNCKRFASCVDGANKILGIKPEEITKESITSDEKIPACDIYEAQK